MQFSCRVASETWLEVAQSTLTLLYVGPDKDAKPNQSLPPPTSYHPQGAYQQQKESMLPPPLQRTPQSASPSVITRNVTVGDDGDSIIDYHGIGATLSPPIAAITLRQRGSRAAGSGDR